jgi:hypothetical protein
MVRKVCGDDLAAAKSAKCAGTRGFVHSKIKQAKFEKVSGA